MPEVWRWVIIGGLCGFLLGVITMLLEQGADERD